MKVSYLPQHLCQLNSIDSPCPEIVFILCPQEGDLVLAELDPALRSLAARSLLGGVGGGGVVTVAVIIAPTPFVRVVDAVLVVASTAGVLAGSGRFLHVRVDFRLHFSGREQEQRGQKPVANCYDAKAIYFMWLIVGNFKVRGGFFSAPLPL